MKFLSIVSIFSLVFLSGCAGMQPRMAEKASKTPPPQLTLESDVVQEALEKLPATNQPVKVNQETKVSVSKEEFYGKIPCRSYRISSGKSGYVCRNHKGWILVNRKGMANERGAPTSEPRDKNQKQLAQEQRQKSFKNSRERVAQNKKNKAQKSDVDTSKKAFAQEEQKSEVQKAQKSRSRPLFSDF